MNQPKKSQAGASRSAGKPAPKKQGTGAYFMNWLGRQVGHVKGAVKADVTKKPGAAAKKPAPSPQARSPKAVAAPAGGKAPDSPPATASEKIIYREDKIEEAALPDRPGVILRRTIIDEVVVETETKETPK